MEDDSKKIIENISKENIILFDKKIIMNPKVINDNNKKRNSRNPGIDLIRLIGMYGIIINHILYHHGGIMKFSKYSKYLKILHISSFWHNNAFILISGIVGYKSNKYSNLLYLWIEVFFYSTGIHLYFSFFQKNSIISSNISNDCFPIIFCRYWFFTSYFGMYLFLPVINKGISILNKHEFASVIFSTNILFVIWKDLKNPNLDLFAMHSGNSTLWFLTHYLTGAFIGKYEIIYFGYKKYIFCIICLVLYFFLCYIYFKVYNNELYLGNSFLSKTILSLLKQMLNEKYDGILKILLSISVCLFFLQISYNKYISKITSFFGPLVFGIYLIHENKLIKANILKHTFEKYSDNITLINAMIIVSLKAFKIFIICIFIDFFRNLLFTILKIKKLCILLEGKMIKN